MATLVEALSNQMKELQAKLDPSSNLVQKLNHHATNLATTGDYNQEIKDLCELQTLLNDKDNIAYFNSVKKRKIVEEINVTILTLIRDKIADNYKLKTHAQETKLKKNRLGPKIALFAAVALFGTVFAAVDGASIIQTIIGTFTSITSIPSIVLIPLQVIFAAVAVGAFYGIELNSIGKTLGLRAFDLGKIFKLYAEQAALYDEIFSLQRSAMNHDFTNKDDLSTFKYNYALIKNTYKNFDHKVQEARDAQAKPSLKKTIAKVICTGFAATFLGIIAAVGANSLIVSILPYILGASLAAGPIGLGVTIGLMAICFISAALIFVCKAKAVNEFVNKACGTPSKSVEQLIKKDQQIDITQADIDKMIPKEQERLALKEGSVKNNHNIPARGKKYHTYDTSTWRAAVESQRSIIAQSRTVLFEKPKPLVDGAGSYNKEEFSSEARVKVGSFDN